MHRWYADPSADPINGKRAGNKDTAGATAGDALLASAAVVLMTQTQLWLWPTARYLDPKGPLR